MHGNEARSVERKSWKGRVRAGVVVGLVLAGLGAGAIGLEGAEAQSVSERQRLVRYERRRTDAAEKQARAAEKQARAAEKQARAAEKQARALEDVARRLGDIERACQRR